LDIPRGYSGHMAALDMLAAEVGVHGRTLRRAADEGAIRATRVSPRKLTLSPGEESYLLRAWPLLGQLRALLRTERNVRFAMLFGSRARGEERPDSDLDLLVELDDESLAARMGLIDRLEAATCLEVQLVTLDTARRAPVLLADAIEDGRVLVDRVGRWVELLDRYPAISEAAVVADAALRERAAAALAEVVG
jgi:predicted nucleotidyltransferase